MHSWRALSPKRGEVCESEHVYGSPPFGPTTHVRRASWARRFVRRYGWRAYALPILVILTVAALLRPTPGQNAAAEGSTPPHQAATGARVVAGPPIQITLGKDGTPCTQNTLDKLILVSIQQQRIWMCAGTSQVYSTLVTTGAVDVGDGTPLGTWHIQDKQTDRYLVGPGYRDYVHWWMPFNGDFGFHDAPWQTMPYGAPGYIANGSHGCVHLPATAMSWMFNWAQTGTTVAIEA